MTFTAKSYQVFVWLIVNIFVCKMVRFDSYIAAANDAFVAISFKASFSFFCKFRRLKVYVIFGRNCYLPCFLYRSYFRSPPFRNTP